MKETSMLFGLALGLVAGALLYKHSQDAKTIVNKGERAVKKEMENLENMKDKMTSPKTQSKSKKQS